MSSKVLKCKCKIMLLVIYLSRRRRRGSGLRVSPPTGRGSWPWTWWPPPGRRRSSSYWRSSSYPKKIIRKFQINYKDYFHGCIKKVHPSKPFIWKHNVSKTICLHHQVTKSLITVIKIVANFIIKIKKQNYLPRWRSPSRKVSARSIAHIRGPSSNWRFGDQNRSSWYFLTINLPTIHMFHSIFRFFWLLKINVTIAAI